MPATVSIIMPCHNAERYLSQAIESVIRQTYEDWELLITDDCSTDSSSEIIARYCSMDQRIRAFKTGAVSGSPAEPRNIGLRNATGRFVAFLDSDDQWLPGKLEFQLRLFNDEKTAVVFSYYEKINEYGERNDRIIRSPKCVNYASLLKGNCIGNLTGVYDTQKVGKVYQKKIHHEDYVMWLEVLRKGFVAKNANECFALYREHKASVSGSKLGIVSWQWNIYRNELGLSLPSSCYYFSWYAANAVLKFLK